MIRLTGVNPSIAVDPTPFGALARDLDPINTYAPYWRVIIRKAN